MRSPSSAGAAPALHCGGRDAPGRRGQEASTECGGVGAALAVWHFPTLPSAVQATQPRTWSASVRACAGDSSSRTKRSMRARACSQVITLTIRRARPEKLQGPRGLRRPMARRHGHCTRCGAAGRGWKPDGRAWSAFGSALPASGQRVPRSGAPMAAAGVKSEPGVFRPRRCCSPWGRARPRSPSGRSSVPSRRGRRGDARRLASR